MKSLELFVGAGGLSIGASQSGFKPVLVTDWDRWVCDTIDQNAKLKLAPFDIWPLVRADIKSMQFDKFSEKIDLITGGPPCQPFSMGGLHRAQLDERDMFPQAIRAVREVKPKAFIFENVKGLNRAAFSNYLEYIRLQLRHPEILARKSEAWIDHLSRLEDHETRGKFKGLHYNIVMRILNAADFGVPQKRERIFIVGFRSDTGVDWHFPTPTHSRDALDWAQWRSGAYWEMHEISKRSTPKNPNGIKRADKIKEQPSLEPWMTLRDAISDLPDPEKRPRLASEYSDHRFQPGAKSYPGHTGSPLDEPAKTLKAGVHGVPGGENMIRRPNGSVRYFSVRESARIQTFPDNMRFHGSWSETMRQLGNAVPCQLARVLTLKIKTGLQSTESN